MQSDGSSSESDSGRRHQRHSPNDDRKPPAPRDSDDDNSDCAPDAGTGRSKVKDLSMLLQHRLQLDYVINASRQPQSPLSDAFALTLPLPSRPPIVPPPPEDRKTVADANWNRTHDGNTGQWNSAAGVGWHFDAEDNRQRRGILSAAK